MKKGTVNLKIVSMMFLNFWTYAKGVRDVTVIKEVIKGRNYFDNTRHIETFQKRKIVDIL